MGMGMHGLGRWPTFHLHTAMPLPTPFPCSHLPIPMPTRTFQAIYVPADDLTDPAPATTFAHLDATTVLSRGIAGAPGVLAWVWVRPAFRHIVVRVTRRHDLPLQLACFQCPAAPQPGTRFRCPQSWASTCLALASHALPPFLAAPPAHLAPIATRVRFPQSWASTPRWTPWTPPPACSTPASWARSTTAVSAA